MDTNDTNDTNNKKLLEQINLISSIGEGQTICLSDMSIIDHNSWKSSLKRRWYKESRENLVDFIEETIQKYQTNFSGEVLKDSFNKSKKGILNLIKTYQSDTNLVNELNRIIEIIDKCSKDRTQNIFCKNKVQYVPYMGRYINKRDYIFDIPRNSIDNDTYLSGCFKDGFVKRTIDQID